MKEMQNVTVIVVISGVARAPPAQCIFAATWLVIGLSSINCEVKQIDETIYILLIQVHYTI